ncbi:MAG: GNAT family N-acetyltransferase [Acidimicrobiales bacterium]
MSCCCRSRWPRRSTAAAACGDPALGTIAPHITLVPPVNVRGDDLGVALRVLRAAATGPDGPMTLTIGPAATFGAESPTLFLDVSLDRPGLERLRHAVLVPPLARFLDHAFRPHVTLATELADDRRDAAVSVLRDYRTVVEIGRLTLLEQRRAATGRRTWVTLADAALGSPTRVVRGGLSLDVTDSAVADPEVADFLAAAGGGAPARPGPHRYLAARTDGRTVGVLALVRLDRREPMIAALTVAEAYRCAGVGRLLVERAVTLAGDGGATRLAADPRIPEDWLAALGWPERDEPRQPPTRWRPI